MKIRLSQLFFVISQPKLSVHFKILFSLMFFKEAIIILSSMYCFWRNTHTYLHTSDDSVTPSLNHIGFQTRTKFDGQCLKQVKVTFNENLSIDYLYSI